MSDPHPKRLTAKRASALIAAVERGVGEWRLQVADIVETANHQPTETLVYARHLDEQIADALAARTILLERYIADAEPAEVQPALFGETTDV